MASPIERIMFQGLRGFVQPQHVEVRPLTLVFGANGSGKSTVLRLPLLLLGSVRPGVAGLDLRAAGMEHASRITDLFPVSEPVRSLRFSISGSDFDVGAELQRYVDGVREGLWLAEFHEGPKRETFEFGAARDAFGWVPRHALRTTPALLAAIERIVHVGPFRLAPQVAYAMPGSDPGGMGHAGENAAQIIAFDFIQSDGSILARVNDWYDATFGVRLRVETHGLYSFQLLADLGGATVPFSALGSGLTQSLAPITALALAQARTGHMVCLEEPELHLHPAAHGALGQFLVQAARNGAGSVVVETHSENLLMRVRRAVVAGDIPKEDVALYWAERTGLRCAIRRLTLNDDGYVEDWPHGVFQEDLKEARVIANLLRARAAS